MEEEGEEEEEGEGEGEEEEEEEEEVLVEMGGRKVNRVLGEGGRVLPSVPQHGSSWLRSWPGEVHAVCARARACVCSGYMLS